MTAVAHPEPTSILDHELTADEIYGMLAALPIHAIGDAFPLVHRFAPGVYAREITMPGGWAFLGEKHKTEHLNIISKGHVSFRSGGEVIEVHAPYAFVSKPGVQKVLLIHDETVWTTIHPTDETDVPTLEAMLIDGERMGVRKERERLNGSQHDLQNDPQEAP
jgi:hypothetical protein